MKQYLLQLKSQLSEMQEELRRRLIKLATTCDTVEKQLEKRVKIAEIIITFSEMCRKLEAEEEKILPFYASTLTDEERAEVETAFYEQPFEDLAKVLFSFLFIHLSFLFLFKDMYTYDILETFWKRFSKVSLDKLALEKERSILQSENMQLKMLLKQYLDGISVNDEIMSQTNPLMILSSRRVLEYVFSVFIKQKKRFLFNLNRSQSAGKQLSTARPIKVVIEAQHVKSAF